MDRIKAIWLLLAPLLAVVCCAPRQAAAQALPSSASGAQFELSDVVQVDRADSTVLAQFQRVKAHLADRQWDEAIDALQKLAENTDGKLVAVSERRYISVGEYCQLQFAALPPEALKLYRRRIDPLARKWYEEGLARRDVRLLGNVVEQAFASSWGDKALLALGDLALEAGDCPAARWHWERILPAEPPPGATGAWPGYPDSAIDPAAVRARLVLASILEGSAARAREELAALARLHPAAKGHLTGREVVYVQALGELLADGAARPKPAASPDWPTFAGSPSRERTAAGAVDPNTAAWRMPLPESRPVADAAGSSPLNAAGALSSYPLLVGGKVFVSGQREIAAVRAGDGRPAWGDTGRIIFRDQLEGIAGANDVPADTLGTPRFTLTACEGRLLARMGNPLTGRPAESSSAAGSSYLACLDLEAEGKLLWKTAAEEGWAFDGSPLADQSGVYVAMRRSDIRPQAHVACFDPQTGRLRWRRFVCSAETPARGMFHQCSHNLLSLAGQTLYFNTNLGAIAALGTADGRLLWLSLYPRARHGDLLAPAAHWQRDLTPCLCHDGTLLAAPADSPYLFAFDAATGQTLWQTAVLEEANQLLGVAGDCLIASGHRLYWVGLRGQQRGRLLHVWPESQEKPGYGRGVLAGGDVLWPTREKIYVLDQRTARLKKTIDLAALGTSGGNLLAADDRLLVAGAHELVALGRAPRRAKAEPPDVASIGIRHEDTKTQGN